MKIGLSTYSLDREIAKGRMTVLDVIDWIADHGGQHVEMVPFAYKLVDNPDLTDAVREHAAKRNLDISNYAILSDFTQDDDAAYEAEIERVMHEVDVANRLGCKLMRHDVAWRKAQPNEERGPAGRIPDPSTITLDKFEDALPRMAAACQRIADYAAQYGITTSVENHLYFVQASDRVQRLIRAVNRSNYKTTVDVGNFLCVDESPVVGVKKNLPLASMIHLKDFYVRPSRYYPGEGWFRTANGNYLRGAILGNGDIDMREVFRLIRDSGYDGYMSVEFEGIEDPVMASRVGLDNAHRLWDEVQQEVARG